MKKSDNLRYFTADQDRDLARENGKAGGVKSGESRRWRKAVRSFLQDYLGKEAPPELQEWMDFYDIPIEDRTNLMALLTSVFSRAMQGDVTAAKTVLEWAGMLPLTEKLESAELERYGQTESEQSRSVFSDSDVIFYDPRNPPFGDH